MPHKYNTYNTKITKLDKKSPLNKGLFEYAIHSSVKLPMKLLDEVREEEEAKALNQLESPEIKPDLE